MSRLHEAYRAIHDQAFMPIFVDDEFDSKMLVEACMDAGMKGLEYTLRRRDAHKMIPWIREQYPDLYLLVGSTLDDEKIVARQRRLFPQLMTLAEIDEFEPDGYISMIGWHEESIRKYAPKRIIMPTCSTVNEAFFQIGAGAHFAKLVGSDLGFVRRCRGDAAFGYCPIIVTGGMNTERIPEGIEAGAALIATGFDLTLKGEPKNVSKKKVAEVMKRYVEVTQAARDKKCPQLAKARGADWKTWLDALPHYHPF
jgi:2-keto-3-deoxy-6-phosphogluconate aldolase